MEPGSFLGVYYLTLTFEEQGKGSDDRCPEREVLTAKAATKAKPKQK